MQDYENYTETSQHYDATRIPISAEVLIRFFSKTSVPLSQMKILDAGCGTGAYSAAVIDHVGHVDAVDLNRGMLSMAAEKFESEKIVFHHAPITNLPFDDDYFDGIMINQVLHHLPDVEDGFPMHLAVFKEFRRVLKPGGVLSVNTCSQEQLENGYWYYHFLKDEVETLKLRYVPIDQLVALLLEAGFSVVSKEIPLNQVLQGDSYFEPRNVLNKTWRDGDSMWALVSEEKTRRILSEIEEMDQKKELDEFFKSKDERRKAFGQITFLCLN